MPAVWTDRHRLRIPESEVWVGVPIDGFEVPARGEVIREALLAASSRIVEPRPHPRSDLTAVHDSAFLTHLETAHDRWMATGYPDDPGRDQGGGFGWYMWWPCSRARPRTTPLHGPGESQKVVRR